MIIAVSRAAAGGGPALSSYQTAVVGMAGVTHLWSCDGATTMTDLVGSMTLTNTGTQSSVTKLVPNNTDGARLFSGGVVQSASNMVWTSSLSIAFWISTTGTQSNAGIVGAWDGSAHGAMCILGLGANQLSFYTDGSSLAGPTLSTSTTYFVVATYDGTDRRIYIDGSLSHGPTAGAAVTTNPTAKMEISGYQSGGQPLSGTTIDDVATFNVALSGADVSALWAAR